MRDVPQLRSSTNSGGYGLNEAMKDTDKLSAVQPDSIAANVGTNLDHSALQNLWQLIQPY